MMLVSHCISEGTDRIARLEEIGIAEVVAKTNVFLWLEFHSDERTMSQGCLVAHRWRQYEERVRAMQANR
jgi:archaellum component FlaD/FlaE